MPPTARRRPSGTENRRGVTKKVEAVTAAAATVSGSVESGPAESRRGAEAPGGEGVEAWKAPAQKVSEQYTEGKA